MAGVGPGRDVFVTGATDGIGAAFARVQAERGARLVLTGRRPEPRVSVELPPGAVYLEADLARPEGAGLLIRALGDRSVPELDLALLCAGAGWVGDLEGQDAASIEELVAVNLEASISLAHGLIPLLEERRGKLVFVGSVVACQAAPEYAVYAATKAALDGFARSLASELHGRVEVSILHPGPTRTGIHEKSGLSRDRIDWERFPPAEEVATRMADLLEGSPPRRRVLGAAGGAMDFLGRHAARPVDGLRRFVRNRRASTEVLQGGGRGPAGSGRPRCAITGAADGIGRALALELAGHGWDVVGIDLDTARAARTAEEVRALGADARFLEADLARPRSVREAVASLADCGPLDLVVHNAGTSCTGAFEEHDLSRQLEVVRLNLLAPMLLTAGLLARNVLAQDGRFVFVSSLSHFTGYPGATVYAATKDGLASYARSLRLALGGRRSRVLCVFPGPTRTEHARRYAPPGDDSTREARRMSPAELARRIRVALDAGDATLIPGAANRVAAAAGLVAPRLSTRAMRKLLYEPFVSPGSPRRR